MLFASFAFINQKRNKMETRLNIGQLEPQAFKAMMALESYLAQTSLSPTLKELIKIRASQINGCAYCIDMHTRDALQNGERNQRIFLLSAWREAGSIFTDEERAVLAMTEEVTLIGNGGLSDASYQQALHFFTEQQIAQIIMAIVVINSWNRIAVSSHTQIPR